VSICAKRQVFASKFVAKPSLGFETGLRPKFKLMVTMVLQRHGESGIIDGIDACFLFLSQTKL
jgi:hypothetical protein